MFDQGFSLIEIVIFAVAILALGMSIWTLNTLQKTKLAAQKALRIAKDCKEREFRNAIYTARNRAQDFNIQLHNLDQEHIENQVETYENVYRSIVINYLDIFNNACQLYWDNTIDREPFKEEFGLEIKKIVENKSYQHFFKDDDQDYKAILCLYKRWNKTTNITQEMAFV